jgi:hypothetical protein
MSERCTVSRVAPAVRSVSALAPRPGDPERLPDDEITTTSGEPLRGTVEDHDLPFAVEHEHPFVDRLDDLEQLLLRPALALEELAALDHAQSEHREELREQQDDDDRLVRAVRRRLDVLAPTLRVALVALLHGEQVGARAVECGSAEAEIGGDRLRAPTLEHRRDHVVANLEVLRPVALEAARRLDAPRLGELGHLLGDALRHARIGGARFVDVLHLQVRVARGERVEHAPPRFLHVVLQRGDQVQPVDEAFGELTRVARGAAELIEAERAGGRAEQRKEDEHRRRASTPHERAGALDHCASTSSS